MLKKRSQKYLCNKMESGSFLLAKLAPRVIFIERHKLNLKLAYKHVFEPRFRSRWVSVRSLTKKWHHWIAFTGTYIP